MKHLLLVSAAALLLAACDTVPSGQPYGQPYPPAYPGDAYPPAPYPPQPGYPAPGYPSPTYPSPGQYPQGPQLSCPISVSRDWRAWINMMPGSGAPTLNVTGKATTPSGGYQVSFDRSMQIRKGYPTQAFVTLNVFLPTGGATQAVVVHDLRGQWPLSQRIDSVEIRCGDQTLASIAPVATAR